jgi:hypothetical protein
MGPPRQLCPLDSPPSARIPRRRPRGRSAPGPGASNVRSPHRGSRPKAPRFPAMDALDPPPPPLPITVPPAPAAHLQRALSPTVDLAHTPADLALFPSMARWRGGQRWRRRVEVGHEGAEAVGAVVAYARTTPLPQFKPRSATTHARTTPSPFVFHSRLCTRFPIASSTLPPRFRPAPVTSPPRPRPDPAIWLAP